jgi:universal stress protein E
MQRFNNILFVSHGVTDETEALKQALSLARNNKAELHAVILCPDFPKEMADYKEKYESSLIEQLQASIRKAREGVNVSESDVPVRSEVEGGDTPAIRIIRHVIKGSYDLIIKEAAPQEGGKGFKAIDMELLRKCPCPVWLTRPISRHRGEIKVAVAIDPQSMAPEGHDLSLRLLELSRSLADTCSGELNIISCWDYEFEEYLRGNLWIKVSDDELIRTVQAAQNDHRTALEKILKKSGVQGTLHVHHLRGRADKMIPQYVADKKIDILVMGTVARTGIYSFIIGNTAENILQQVSCSLLALKPNGFISPVKAYE